MLSPKRPPPPIPRPPPKQRRFGGCRQFGHGRRNCRTTPHRTAPPAAVNHPINQNRVEAVPKTPPSIITAVPDPSSIDWESVMFVVFDLENTGRMRDRDEIIEIGAVILDKNGIPIKDANFSEFVKPTRDIPPFITELTTITNNKVADAQPFPMIAEAFIPFMH